MAYITFQPKDYFNTKLWNGNSSTQAITGIGFQPDFVWLKQRTGTQNHQLLDAIRGANNCLFSNLTNTAVQDTDILNSFDSDGYTLGYQDQSNDTGATYVGWNWLANGAGSSNTDGAINSTVSANTTSGFSIVSYTGTLSGNGNTTVGHGLGVAPKMIITKSRSNAENWGVYHKDLTANNILQLNTTSAQIDTSSEGTVTAPTSSVFTVNYRGEYGNSGQNYIAYCFAEKKGFSKFGSYEGNGNTDGSFVYTGFKPAFVMMKGIDSGGSDNWNTCDNKRIGYNAANWRLYPNAIAGENTTSLVDFLSNGFKLRVNSTDVNANAKTYIYMAFAEEPLVSSNGVPNTAR